MIHYNTIEPVPIILCKGKENEQVTVSGLNIPRDIHHKAWFQMIKLFPHLFVSSYKWPPGKLGWDE